MTLIAVGDRVAKIAWFLEPRHDEEHIEWQTSSIAKLSGSMLPKNHPQTEAICADGLGRVLLLQETPPRVELIERSIWSWRVATKFRACRLIRMARGAKERYC